MTTEAEDLIREMAQADLWDECEDGVEPNLGGVTSDFQEARENEAQDWIIRARRILGMPERRPLPEPEDEEDA